MNYRLLKTDEAAAFLGLSPKTLANWRAEGFVPPVTYVGGAVRYNPRTLAEWVEAQEKRHADSEPRREVGVAIQGRWSRVVAHHRLGRHRTQSDQSAAA